MDLSVLGYREKLGVVAKWHSSGQSRIERGVYGVPDPGFIEPGGLCRNEIGKRLVRQVPDVTRLLDRLEDAKLISRQRGGEDRRYVTTRITKAGLKLLDELDAQVCAMHREHVRHLDEAQLRKLVELLEAVRAAW